ncbi:TonB-dependent receptor [Flexibacter flexilis]|uniref:TonB-dependent receptor n=1 Tax=Flexibacter flexilis TaxID=998 RepID=UPI001C88571E|nr:TonB-dependent receptor [Flexibacter flexilis]
MVVIKSQAQTPNCEQVLRLKIKEAQSQTLLPNAFISLNNKNIAVSDLNGNAQIQHLCLSKRYTLEISFVGYLSQQITFLPDTLHELQIAMQPDIRSLKAVEVSTSTLHQNAPTDHISVLEKETLDQQRGLSLGQMLKAVTGVNALQTGPSIFKPVIHGLYGNRVAIEQNGVRQEGQQWGTEHAPEIDAFAASRISVVKGAGSVRYGADAPGGVILVEPAPLPQQPIAITGEANAVGITNGRVGATALRLEGRLPQYQSLAWRVQGSIKRGGNVQTPKYYLDNTGLSEAALSATAAWQKPNTNFGTEVFYSYYHTKLGIFSGSHIGNLTDLENALARPDSTFDYSFSYKINRPYQQIDHHLLKAKAFWIFPRKGKLIWQIAAQSNSRLEYDLHKPRGVPASYNKPELSFYLNTQNTNLTFDFEPIGRWTLATGLTAQHQSNYTKGLFLIPDYDGINAGGFFTALWEKDRLQAELGVRADARSLQVTNNKYAADSSLFFGGWAAATGLNYQLNDVFRFSVQSASTWRAPSVNELYSRGVHHGTASYEEGKADMQPERAWNSSITTQINHDKLLAEISFYANYIHQYIYLQPQAPQTVLTVRGAFPFFKYQQANVWFRGMDFSAEYHLTERWHLSSKISLVRAYNMTAADYLVFTPADRYQHEISYHLPSLKLLHTQETVLGINVTYVDKQWRTPATGDYAAAPAAYTLYGLRASTQWAVGKQTLGVSLSADNVLNKLYRDYLNRFRYYAYDVGRSVSLRLKWTF